MTHTQRGLSTRWFHGRTWSHLLYTARWFTYFNFRLPGLCAQSRRRRPVQLQHPVCMLWKIVKCYIGPCKVTMYNVHTRTAYVHQQAVNPGESCLASPRQTICSPLAARSWKKTLAAFEGNIQCEITVDLQISQYFAALRDPLGPHHSVDNILCHLVMLSFGDKRDTDMVKESLKIRILFICCA